MRLHITIKPNPNNLIEKLYIRSIILWMNSATDFRVDFYPIFCM